MNSIGLSSGGMVYRARAAALSIITLIGTSGFADTQTPSTPSPISLAATGTVYFQDFDSLVSSGSSSTPPSGWVFLESGVNQNSAYAAGTGSSSAGDTFSFGVGGANLATDRAFGTLQTGGLISTIGATFANNTGATITSLDIAYRGELWRLGTAGGRTDALDFQYSTDATGLGNGTWTGVGSLNFVTPNTAGTAGPRDGNASGNFSNPAKSITGLNIVAGATFWIRWTDVDASGSDDGLAVDNFNLTPQGASGTSTWSGGGMNSNWSTSANWNSAASDGSNLVFGGATRLSNTNNTLNRVGSILFDNTAGTFALAGNALTISGGITNNSSSAQSINLNLTAGAPQQINAASGDLTLGGSLANGGNLLTVTGAKDVTLSGNISGGGGLMKTSSGMLMLSGNNSHSGGTTINGNGTLIVASPTALGAGAFAVNNTAKAQISTNVGTVVIAGLSVNAGSSTPTATFDVGKNSVVILYTSSSPFATIRAQILNAADGGAWDQAGITDSFADGSTTGLGYAEAGDVEGGVSGGGTYVNNQSPKQSNANAVISNQAIILKHTYLGDTDLNGIVDGFDYNNLTSNIGASGATWAQGDTNYDGKLDEFDYNDLTSNIGLSGLSVRAGPTQVPEPNSLFLAVIGLIGFAIARIRLPAACLPIAQRIKF